MICLPVMHNHTILIFACSTILLLCLLWSCTSREGIEGTPETTTSQETDKPDFRQRLSELRERIAAVAAALEHADGFANMAGRIDLQIPRFFADYVAWELDHPEMMTDALASDGKFRKILNVSESERQRRYRFQVDHELAGSMQILDQAMARLSAGGEGVAVPTIRWDRMKYDDGFFRVDGRPVFPAGFNMLPRSMIDVSRHPEWAAKDKTLMRSFLEEMHRLGVGVLGAGANVPALVMQDGTIDKPRIRRLAETIRQQGRMGFRVDILLSWHGKRDTLESLWPGITEYYGNGMHLDIDHPGTRVMVARVMAGLLPALRDLPAIVSWDLANEPFFDLGMWSPHTLRKYHAWLAQQYGTVAKLNAVWKTRYAAFGEVPLPAERPREQCSAGEWYDRVTFHSYRTASFFEFVQGEIRKHIPDAVIHVKAQDNSSLGPMPEAVTDGIDREMLTAMSSLQGVDTRPLPVTEPRMAAGFGEGSPETALKYDGSFYGFHWLGQSFLYDYLTSLEPHRPIVDFEYHAFSINAIRIPDIRRSHVRAALWMAHLHGLVGNMTWYWHRRYGPCPFPSDYFKVWLYGSISTQPVIAAEYFQTMSKLNAFSEQVAVLATVPDRPVRLLVSKPSYIQNQAHINALHRAYEGVCFHGLRVGFVTERMLAERGVPKDCKMIVIPDAEYVGLPALQALKQAAGDGVRLVRFGRVKTAYDAHGTAHAPESITFLNDAALLDYGPAPEVSHEFRKLLSPLTATLPVQVRIVEGDGAFGVMHRLARMNGDLVLLLVNVCDKQVRVQLRSREGNPVEGYDMLNREAVDSAGFALPFQAVRLIRISL